MKKMWSCIRFTIIFTFLFVNLTGFSSASFTEWMSFGKEIKKDVGVNDMPPQWQLDLLEFVSCGRAET